MSLFIISLSSKYSTDDELMRKELLYDNNINFDNGLKGVSIS